MFYLKTTVFSNLWLGTQQEGCQLHMYFKFHTIEVIRTVTILISKKYNMGAMGKFLKFWKKIISNKLCPGKLRVPHVIDSLLTVYQATGSKVQYFLN